MTYQDGDKFIAWLVAITVVAITLLGVYVNTNNILTVTNVESNDCEVITRADLQNEDISFLTDEQKNILLETTMNASSHDDIIENIPISSREDGLRQNVEETFTFNGDEITINLCGDTV